MTVNDSGIIESRYSDNWRNVQEGCALCEMEKRTHWYLETQDWVVAERLGGGPFVIYKRHQQELSDDEWKDMERVVGKVFDDFHVKVLMNVIEDHWHGHLITDEWVDLKDE